MAETLPVFEINLTFGNADVIVEASLNSIIFL
jgi:hypothetical protein